MAAPASSKNGGKEPQLFYDKRFGPSDFTVAVNPLLGGMTHTHGRCVGFFTEFQKCYVQSDAPVRDCKLWKEDYIECKLHNKEKARLKRINDHRLKQEKQQQK